VKSRSKIAQFCPTFPISVCAHKVLIDFHDGSDLTD
jgi:hypothetical protein